MKKVFIAVMMAAAAAVSCQEKIDSVNGTEGEGCELTVKVGGGSKAEGVVDKADQTIRNVQVLVFAKGATDEASTLDAAVYETVATPSTGGTYTCETKVSCTRGQREVWVIVNANEDYVTGGTVASLKDIKSASTVLKDNKVEGASFVMAGNAALNLTKTQQSVDVNVKRMAAKVVVKTITNNMATPAYQADGRVRITGAYLLSVAGYQVFSNLDVEGTPAPVHAADIDEKYWFGKNVAEPEGELLTFMFDSPMTLKHTKSIEDVCTLYAYPNDAEESDADVWSKRASLLVVEAVVGDDNAGVKEELCYYPVQLPAIESNTVYEVSLSIKHKGSPEPYKPVQFTDVTATVNIVPWDKKQLTPEI